MKTHKVTQCQFRRKRGGKLERGLYILDIRHNTCFVFDKDVIPVCPIYDCVTEESSEGNIYFDLRRKL